MSDKFDITINGQPIAVEPGTMVLDAARRRGVPVPTLC
nr:(2Fe-2S)-binding protein [bacterium]